MQGNRSTSWWTDETEAKIFNDNIKKHLLSLNVAYWIEGNPKTCWILGSLVYTNKMLIWITSGHFLKKLDELLCQNGVGGIKARWFDNCPNKNANPIPCDYSSLLRLPIDIEGYDFGIVQLPQLNADQILSVRENVPLTEVDWMLNGFEAEGYYLVGIPEEFTEFEQINNGPQKYEFSSFGTIVSVPLTKEDRTIHQSENNFWKHAENFYGKISPIKNDNGRLLGDILGMSGGPIFGVRKINERELEYRVIAIQSNWFQNQFTRGTYFNKVIENFNDAIERAKGKKDVK